MRQWSQMPDPNRAFSPAMYWVGHIATLVSIFAIFSALSAAFLFRSMNPANWRPIHLPVQLMLSTVLLLSTSLAIEMARYVLKRTPLQVYTSWLIRTAVFATAFVATQALSWRLMVKEAMASNSNESFFFVLTGAHAFHVLGGMVALGYLLWRCWHPWSSSVELRRRTITSMLATYWHFMGAIWLGLYAMMWSKSV